VRATLKAGMTQRRKMAQILKDGIAERRKMTPNPEREIVERRNGETMERRNGGRSPEILKDGMAENHPNS